MQVEGKSLLIRADANARMGTGHLMRCLALAQGWQAQGGHTIFITACDKNGLSQRLSKEGFQTINLDRPFPDPVDWEITSQVLAAYPDAWVVLDGYHFDSLYQRRIKEAGHPLLVIDDLAHLDHYYADIVLNQNTHAEQLHYSSEPYTRLLLGTRYVLLRSDFLAWQGWRREIPDVARKVLVTLGGSDPDNQTLKVIKALKQVDVEGLEATIVVGACNLHFQELQSAIRHSPFAIRLVRNVTNMPGLMAWADMAISAGGSTCWELAFMGLPVIILVLAENQKVVAKELQSAGIGLSLGWYSEVSETDIVAALTTLISDPIKRATMSQEGQRLVEGKGIDQSCLLLIDYYTKG